jgi:hypothetical protein
MLKALILISAMLVVGCVLDSEKKPRVIDCGTLDFSDNNGEMRDTLTFKDGKCGT